MKNRMFYAAVAAVGAFALSAGAFAQDNNLPAPNPNVVNQADNMALPNMLSVGDQIFIMTLVNANAKEIEESRVAERMAASKGVSNFARRMINAHEDLQRQLISTYGGFAWMHHWETTVGYAPHAGEVGMSYYEHQENFGSNTSGSNNWSNWDYIYPSDWNQIHRLDNMNGYALDNEYIMDMAQDHATLLDAIAARQDITHDSSIQSLISSIRPVVQHHLDEARMFAFNYQDPMDIQRADAWIH